MKNRKGKAWVWAIVIILLIFLIIAIFFIVQSGAVNEAVNPCKKQLEECNYSCGEGIFNKVCKEICTSEYQDCEFARN